jgi:hypothetical protein
VQRTACINRLYTIPPLPRATHTHSPRSIYNEYPSLSRGISPHIYEIEQCALACIPSDAKANRSTANSTSGKKNACAALHPRDIISLEIAEPGTPSSPCPEAEKRMAPAAMLYYDGAKQNETPKLLCVCRPRCEVNNRSEEAPGIVEREND